jgi:hypothetical protein
LKDNDRINELGTEKLQLTVRMCEEIERYLGHNRKIREKEEFMELIDQNKKYKAKDNYTWKYLE